MRRRWLMARALLPAAVLAAAPVYAAGATVPERPREPADTVVQVWIPEVTASAGARVSVRVRLGLGTTGLTLARASGALRFEPALLAYDGAAAATDDAESAIDPTLAASGVVAFEIESDPSAPGFDTGTLIAVWFRVVGSPGVRADVLLELEELVVASGGTDVLAGATIRDGAVHIR